VISFAVTFALVPGWYRFLLFIPYGIVLARLIRKGRLFDFRGRPLESIVLPGDADARASDGNPDR
jgi:hypothetical protein